MGHIGVGELLVLMILGIMFTLPVLFGIALVVFLRRRGSSPATVAREYQQTASAVHAAIDVAGVRIDDLSVAFAGGRAALSGSASSEAERERAASIAASIADVRIVDNGIVVRAR